MIGSGGGTWDAPLKSTVRAQNTIKLNCAMNDSFLFIYFHRRLFFCLRRSGFVVGAQENGLGARPNFLYAGKTLLCVCVCVCVCVCELCARVCVCGCIPPDLRAQMVPERGECGGGSACVEVVLHVWRWFLVSVQCACTQA